MLVSYNFGAFLDCLGSISKVFQNLEVMCVVPDDGLVLRMPGLLNTTRIQSLTGFNVGHTAVSKMTLSDLLQLLLQHIQILVTADDVHLLEEGLKLKTVKSREFFKFYLSIKEISCHTSSLPFLFEFFEPRANYLWEVVLKSTYDIILDSEFHHMKAIWLHDVDKSLVHIS